jgi:hypothetical protein
MFNKATKENKSLYGNLLVKSIVYSRTSSNDTRRAYSNLSKSERSEIENVLEYQKNHGDVRSYETLFLLKLYGPDEFSIDEAIDLLKEWENQLSDFSQIGWAYLNVCFYLAVCYSAKAIHGGVRNTELSQLAMTYFRKSEDFAKKFDKGTIKALCYLGEKDDIHCIVDKEDEASLITGVIKNIKHNKGILAMICGLEVPFNAKDYDMLRDEGTVLKGIIGFKYSGPGLYSFRPDVDDELRELALDIHEEKEITFEELEKSYVPTEDLVEETDSKPNQPEESRSCIKIVGKIDLSKFSSSPKIGNKEARRKLIDGEDFDGVIEMDWKEKKIKCDCFPNLLKIEDNSAELYEGDHVTFMAKSNPHNRDKSKIFWTATNVRVKDN